MTELLTPVVGLWSFVVGKPTATSKSTTTSKAADQECPPLHFALLVFRGQRPAAFGEDGPGFLVGLVFVAILFQRLHGEEHEAGFARGAENDGGGEEIPDVLRNYVSSEDVDLLEGVVLLPEIVGLELTKISCPGADGGAFDLHAEDVRAVLDSYIVRA